MTRCAFSECEKTAFRRGLCSMHWSRERRSGRLPNLPTLTPEQRFWRHVEPVDGQCWPWKGTSKRGYGVLKLSGRQVLAHRLGYELLVGPIPTGLTLDHLCRNPICVNPAHLEPVTDIENVMRGVADAAHNARKTHCKRGHPFDEANTRYRRTPAGTVGRVCRACAREAQRKRP